MIRLKVLAENRAKKRGILGEHGLSLLVETDNFKVLFDAGQTDVFSLNADMESIDLSLADALVISHGHYDHTGGVPEFCMINHKAPIYIHPDAFCERYNAVQGKPAGNCIGIPWSCQDRDMFKNRLVYVKEPVRIHKDILLSGEIPQSQDRQSLNFIKRNISGGYEADMVTDEQFMIVNGSEGIFIFVGCSHPGVLNCVAYAKYLFPDTNICGLIGGMHIEKYNTDQLDEIVAGLKSAGIEKIAPMHCSGVLSSCFLKSKFGDSCFLLNSGDELILEKK
ncbi:7,8-dihydropterin-6-yl-methyl-4-(beta-D-ribofuranosyl)aminobenzene 5'-phosphate synthase [Anaerobacterium chartisolvens]|uniref:7, 8-dihydropterin-6-yl-methyl-4-(Beta-D-ribofuranosyl)aminobenzene 5'-phosphate synthase n=1 Tax=Anaerobacterium chartisolvens TaxID=1297424 RepID=A0A369B8P5_9FIRM|nr:MBL fold metallo-hydrolase [Anaerobacterium chartisolvens]RCX17902.1 7,8-dihydropterin-6-yl-methyl-4-(beta-D-ribofuranosyl)aminobenzene 5'-phosphate synthase [Anaerobacterium chartisolvens]